ncbi:phosphoribosyltransferase-like protein [Thiocapsa sp. UBA6158]|uniref:phosphoribosyltransferase-like protein n=1 Tax=Thiocapsa sp. UBA6158 TaxID=1947692 RepID=UPI0025E5107F|nr:hypothetical protein [Thiocapsa sp. UBA6158]
MKEKLEALAAEIADYREGDIPRPDADHVGRWLAQFDADEREPLLDELIHVWSKTYFSKASARDFIGHVISADKLAGADPKAFWAATNVLDTQKNGHSQRDLRSLFAEELLKATGLSLSCCGGSNRFVYLDDVLFTGNRIQHDLKRWLVNAPQVAEVHVILLAYYRYGEWTTDTELKAEASRLGKTINFTFWRALEWENRKYYRFNSDVLWPTRLPPEATGYDQGRFPLVPRAPGGLGSLFSSDARRDVIEQALLNAGLRIRSFSANPKQILRPLGFGEFGVGFGSLFLSYRNCPNNSPLALWWGGRTNPPSHPFNKWYPLVPRRTYGGDDDF